MPIQQTMLRNIPRMIRANSARRLTSLCTVTQSTVEHLGLHGYAIQDDVLPKSEISGLRSEMEHLIDEGLATPNKTHVISARGTRAYEKSSVLQTELQTLSSQELTRIPGLHELHTDGSLAALMSVFFPRLTLREQFVKVQRACSDLGCFPIHVDSSSVHDSRLVTALLYVHEEWEECDGGALRIYNTPISYVDITPKPGRLVVLSSCNMHHRVLPCSKTRYAITIWLSGQLREKEIAKMQGCLEARVAYEMVSRGLRDAGVRLMRKAEWVESVRESHDAEVAKEVVREFQKSLGGIGRVVPRVICGRQGFEGVGIAEVEEIVRSEERLKRGFEKVAEICGGIPFLW